MNMNEFNRMIEWMRTVLHFSQVQIDGMTLKTFSTFIPAYESWKGLKTAK